MEQKQTINKRERILDLYRALGGTTYIAARLGVNNSTLYQAKLMQQGIPAKFYMGFMQLAREFRDQGLEVSISINLFAFVTLNAPESVARKPTMRPAETNE